MATKYRVIIADPPWRYGGGGESFRGSAEHHYPTVTPQELGEIPVKDWADPAGCVLLLWSTWPMLPTALGLIGAWGFEYVTGFPWLKLQGAPQLTLEGGWSYRPSYGVGFWARGCSEMVLVARRGNPAPPPLNFVGILSERFEHSRKPENLYEYAESMPGPYLELFARRARAGWDAWGNEIQNTLKVGD